MTHFALEAFRTDQDAAFPSLKAKAEEDCTFCSIAAGKLPAHIVYQDEHTVAFLDILPLRRGHTLVIPRAHHATISSLPPDAAAALAQSVTRVSRALGAGLEDPRMQVITNQIYAQVVPHVHYHLVPAPKADFSSSQTPSSSSKKDDAKNKLKSLWARIGHGRTELNDEEAQPLAEKIREAIKADTEYQDAIAAWKKSAPAAKL